MAHLHDTNDIICLSDLAPRLQAIVRASRKTPATSVPVPVFEFSQASDDDPLDLPNGAVPGSATMTNNTHQTVEISRRNLPGSLFIQPQTSQIRQSLAPMDREDSPSFPLQPASFQPPCPSFPCMQLAAPIPAQQPTMAPFTTASTSTTPTTPTSNLPSPFLPIVQLPAIGAPRPSPSEMCGSVVPSVAQKCKTGSKNIGTNPKKKKRGAEGQVIEVKESAQGGDEQATDELTTLIRDLKNDLASFRVDLPTPFVVGAQGDATGDPALAIRSLAQFVTDQVTIVRGGLLLLATQVSNLETHFKTSRKVPKGERSDQENSAYKYIKVRTFQLVGIHWLTALAVRSPQYCPGNPSLEAFGWFWGFAL